MEVVALIFLLVFKYTLRQVRSFPVTSASTETCLNAYAEYPQNSSSSLVLFQDCNNTWFYGTTQQVEEININLSRQAKSLAFLGKDFFIKTEDKQFFHVNLETLVTTNLNLSCDSLYLSASKNEFLSELVLLCNQSTTIIQVKNDSSIKSSRNSLSRDNNFIMMKCQKILNQLCFLISDLSSIYTQNKLSIGLLQLLYQSNSSVAATMMQLRQINASLIELYVGHETGEIRRFRFNLLKITLEYAKSYYFFNSTNLYKMKVHSSLLVASDDEGSIIIYNIDKDYKILQANYRENMTNDNSSLGLDLYIAENSTLKIFNKPNRFTNERSLRGGGSGSSISCKSMFYYDKNAKTCMSCSHNCTACNPNNGSCLSCKPNYFLIEGACQSCYYSSDILTNYLDKCFSQMEQGVMNNSEKMVSLLSVVLSNFANLLNLCGILFLFVKLINNWNLLSLYFFLPIKNIPFFLENILAMLFTNFNSSVLEALNINIDFNLGIKDSFSNEKLKLANITVDFAAYNGENMIMFIYSLVLMMTILRLIHNLLGRWNLSLFQDNTAIAILEEFIASFTVSYLPYSLIIGSSGYPTMTYKINAILSYTLMLIALMAPFLFLITGNKHKIHTHSKPINLSDPDETNKVLKECAVNSKKVWISESQRQKCFYCILSFSIALLACNSQPLYFLFIVGLVHVSSVLNVLWTPGWSVNQLIQKLNFLLFHCCYVLLYTIENDSTKLYISIAAVMLIILGGTHELLSTVLTQIYCLYKLAKRKCQERKKMQALFQKIDEARSDPLRCHPMNLSFLPKKQKVSKPKTITLNIFSPQIVTYQAEDPSSHHSDLVEVDEQDPTGKHVRMKLKAYRKKPTKSAKNIDEQAKTERESELRSARGQGKSESRIGRSRRRLRE